MSEESKKRAAVVFLGVMAAWPLIHHLLVVTLEVNPWKFFGWSMYCRPANIIAVYLFEVGEEGQLRLPRHEITPRIGEEIERFGQLRTDFGRLTQPGRLARVVFEENPRLDKLRIVVENLTLDPGTARFRPSRLAYDYARARGGKRAPAR